MADQAPHNPYLAPQATILAERVISGVVLEGGRRVPAAAAVRWLQRGWALFTSAPGDCIGMAVVSALIVFALSAVPYVKMVAQIPIIMLFGGGYIGCRAFDTGARFRFTHLFAGFSECARPLALLGVTSVVLNVVGVMLIALATLGTIPASLWGGGVFSRVDPAADLSAMAPMFLFAGAALVWGLLLTSFFLFAPVLVAVYHCRVLDALRWSFSGCIKSMLPLLLLGLLQVLLVFASVFTLFLGLIVLIPVFYASIYFAARDVFEA